MHKPEDVKRKMQNDETTQIDKPEVGYCKPPQQHQFRKGTSGNPSGRRKKTHTTSKDVFKEVFCEQKLSIKINGEKRTVSAIEALSLQLRGLALSGNPRAMAMVFKISAEMDLLKSSPSDRLDELIAAMRAGPMERGQSNED